MFSILNKKFNFADYLLTIGYSVIEETLCFVKYTDGNYNIFIYKPNHVRYDKVIINLGNFNMATLRFMPNSKIMVDMILKNIKIAIDSFSEDVQRKIKNEEVQ